MWCIKYLLIDGFSQAHADGDVIRQVVLHPQSEPMTAPSPEKQAGYNVAMNSDIFELLKKRFSFWFIFIYLFSFF